MSVYVTPSLLMRILNIGLGTKKLSILQPGDSDDIHLALTEAFPKLSKGGRYELQKSTSYRQLEIIPCPGEGYKTTYLKEVAGQSKIYVRPIANDLPMKVEVSHSSMVGKLG